NRVWRNFMGRGLVEAEDDLRLTNPPSNDELFSALVADFTTHGFDVRRLIRQIMESAAYQRSSEPQGNNRADQRYYSHYLVRRLPPRGVGPGGRGALEAGARAGLQPRADPSRATEDAARARSGPRGGPEGTA